MGGFIEGRFQRLSSHLKLRNFDPMTATKATKSSALCIHSREGVLYTGVG